MPINIRSLQEKDLSQYLQLLSNLTTVGHPELDQVEERFRKINNNPDYHISVLTNLSDDKIVGAGTLLIEHKFIHSLGKVGHIEDIVIDPSYGQQGLGKMIVKHLVELAQTNGCYKVILDCNEKFVGFYEKNNFRPNGICMRIDFL